MSIIRHPVRLAVVAISSLFLLLATVRADTDDKDKAPPGDASGTQVLFDGKSLEGWKKCDFYKAGEVKVEDGTIIMSKGVSMSGITSTRRDLPTTNYELSFEAMRLEGQRFLRCGDLSRRQIVHHFGQRGLGRRRDRPLQPRWDGRLGKRHDPVLPLSEQDLVPLPRPRHRQDDPLPDR